MRIPFTMCALALTLSSASGCATVGWRTLLPSAADLASHRGEAVRVTRRHCASVEVRDSQLAGDTLYGVSGSQGVAIATRDVRGIIGRGTVPLPVADSARAGAPVVRVTRMDRTRVELRDPRLVGDTLVGMAGGVPIGIAAGDICAIEQEVPVGFGEAVSAISMLWVVVGLIGFAAGGGIAFGGLGK